MCNMVGRRAGVGKTSVGASLAVQFAAEGQNTLVVATDPAHSHADSLAQVCSFIGAATFSDISV